MKDAVETALKAGGKKAAVEVAVGRGSMWLAARSGFGTLATALNGGPLVTHLDVTPLVRFAFTHSGVGRVGFKRVTALEARIFMRADRRVVLRLEVQTVRAAGKLARDGTANWVADYLREAGRPWLRPNPAPDDPEPDDRLAGTLWLAAVAGLLPDPPAPEANP